MVSPLSSEDRRALIAAGIFSERPTDPCPDCGGFHLRRSPVDFQGSACPRVKHLEWMGNGNRIRVEYWQQGLYDESNTIYPEDLFDEGDEPGDPTGASPG